MSAPKTPVSTFRTRSFSFSTKYKYSSRPFSGGAAAVKFGLRPLEQSPSRVNWDMTNASPSISLTERFIFPASSGKMRRSAHLAAKKSASASTSSLWTPISINIPLLIEPTISPSTETLAVETL
ncbi:hypothetical protein R80B4_02633 [Fibrobacteres bacterium R8-0-B4]